MQRTGHVSLKVYWWYVRAMTIPLCVLFLTFYVLYEVMAVYGAIWMSKMVDDKDLIRDFFKAYLFQKAINALNASLVTFPPSMHNEFQLQISGLKANQSAALDDANAIRRFYLWWYLGFGLLQAAFVFGYSVAFTFMVARASSYIHWAMIGNKCCDLIIHIFA